MCNTKIDRILQACHLGGRQAAVQPNQGPPISKPLYLPRDTTIVSKEVQCSFPDLVPILNKEMHRFQLAGSLLIEFTVELTGKAYSKSEKNDLFEVNVKNMATFKFNDVAAKMKEVCKNVDRDQTNASIRIEMLQQILREHCEAYGKLFAVSLNRQIDAYMATNKAFKAAYRTYQIKCVHDVALDFVVIAASIATTAATWGATGPVAIVAIARSTVGLAQKKFFYMAIEAGTLADIIDAYFNSLAVLMTAIAEDEKSPNPKIAWNTAKEMGLGAAAGILNIDVPSVSVVGGQMKTLESKMKGLHTDRLKTGEKMTKYRKRIEGYQKKIDEEKATLTQEEIAKHSAALLTLDSHQETISEKAEEMFVTIKELISRQKDFIEQLKTYKAGQKGFARYSKGVFGFATSVGLGIGSAGAGAMEHCLAAMNECLRGGEQLIMDKLLRR